MIGAVEKILIFFVFCMRVRYNGLYELSSVSVCFFAYRREMGITRDLIDK